MKKIIIIIIILLGGISGYYYYQNVYIPNKKPTLETETNKANISEYYIYGNHLNMKGTIKKINANFKNADLILWNSENGEKIKYKINYKKNINTLNFNISDSINDGIYLDDIKTGKYQIYLRLKYIKQEKKKEEVTYKYFPLDNKTSYKTTDYYTISKTNKKLHIYSNNKTLSIKATDNKEDVYDVVIDPSGGGIDKGSTGNGYNEADITLEMAEKIQKKLEKQKIKVKLTRTKDSLSSTDYFDEYNDGGRAVISHEVNAKYLFSLEATSSQNTQTSGFSIYTASNINYDFAAKLTENIISKTNLKTSAITAYRIDYGIYSHNFTESEISDNMSYYDRKGYTHYNITTNSNYLYMIRETGGIMTGAYVDNSNPEKVGVNKYYNSNIGAEAYVIRLGYLSNQDDLNAMTTNQENYAQTIANSIISELKSK